MRLIHRFFESAFSVRPEEFKLVQLFFLYVSLVGAYFTLGNTVADSLFLSKMGTEGAARMLPWSFLGLAVGNILVTALYDSVQARFSRIRLILGSQLILAASFAVFHRLVGSGAPAVYFGLVFWVDVCFNFWFALLFSFMSDYLTSRDAKRLFSYILCGFGAGVIAGGAATAPLVRTHGQEALLYVCASLFAGGMLLSLAILRTARPVMDVEAQPGAAPQPSLKALLSSRYIVLAFLVIVLINASNSLIDYQLKIEASRELKGERLALFFGSFYGYQGLASILIQIFLASKILSRLGIIRCLAVLPTSNLLGSLFYLWRPGLMGVAGTNFLRLTFSDTIYTPSRELLFLPLPRSIRLRAQALAGGALGPIGLGLGGLILLLAGPRLGLRGLSFVVIAVGLIVLAAAPFLRRRYLETLAESLRDRHIDSADLDDILSGADTDATVRELLRSSDPDLLLCAMDLYTDQALAGLAPAVRRLTGSGHERVAIKALGLLARHPSPAHASSIRSALRDPRPLVESAALLALGRILGPAAVTEIHPRLHDLSGPVRRTAILALLRDCGEEGVRLAQPHLEKLLKNPAAEERMEAAGILAALERAEFARFLHPLFFDLEKPVRRAAILAASRLRDPSLIPRLLDQVGDLNLRPLAAQALEAMPQGAVKAITEIAFSKAMVPPPYAYVMRVLLPERTLLAGVLGQIGGAEAAKTLWSLMAPEEDLVLRIAAAHALRGLLRRGELVNFDLGALEQRRKEACDEIAATKLAQAALAPGSSHAPLIQDHLRLERELLLVMLSLAFNLPELRQLEAKLSGANRSLQANALELLEESLPHEMGKEVLPLFTPEAPARAPEKKHASPWMRALTRAEPDKEETMSDNDANLYRLITIISFLKQVDLFQDVPANYLASLAEIIKPRSLNAGETLFAEGDAGDALYLVREGKISLRAGGREVAVIGPRECVGEISLMDQQPRAETALALEACDLLRVEAEDFADILATQPRIANSLLRTMAQRLRALEVGRKNQ